MKGAFDRLLVMLGIAGSDPGSRWRNFVSFAALVVSAGIWLAAFLGPSNQLSAYGSIVLCMFTVLLFFQIVLVALNKISADFSINPVRLIRDILISGIYAISAYGYLYRHWGIIGPEGETVQTADYFYFSAVTFSTLGYGDFRPAEIMRLPAASEAIFGNLHLGLLAGGVFLLISEFSKRKNRSKSDEEAQNDQANTDNTSGDKPDVTE